MDRGKQVVSATSDQFEPNVSLLGPCRIRKDEEEGWADK